MIDPRITILAEQLIFHSCRLKPGEKVLIESIGYEEPLVKELIRVAYQAGGLPFVTIKEPAVTRQLLLSATDAQLERMAAFECARMSEMDAYIGLRSGCNPSEMSDVPAEQMDRYERLYGKPLHSDIRVPKTKWVVLRYPSPSMAQASGQSTEAFEDFYFDVCNLNYDKMGRAMQAMVDRLDRTDKVRLVGPGTDISFSVKGIPTVPCAGDCNIPDGEIFTAPVKESVEGVISFNTPSRNQGFTFENICLRFERGRIVQATANDTERINRILDTDAGARYVGEFAIGVNPFIHKPMLDTLFDEKIAGSIHFTPGCCYDEADNGNKSAIHWDLVLIQTPAYGGGEIYFDGELVRKDGRFVAEDLLGLNEENLR